VYVPLNHPVYDYLERAETKGLLKKFLGGTKPFTRKECAEAILNISKRFDQLDNLDKENAAFFISEFIEEFDPKDIEPVMNLLSDFKLPAKPGMFPGIIYINNRNFYSHVSEKIRFHIDPIVNFDYKRIAADSVDGKKNLYRYTYGFRIRGNFGKNLGFYADYRNTREWGKNYPKDFVISLDGLGFVNGYGKHIYHDETIAYLVGGFPLFEIEIGKNINKWGPGRHGNLSLSDNATSYDQIKFKTKFWRLKFTSVTGFLRSYPAITQENKIKQNDQEYSREMHSKKYLAGHRLEIAVADNFDAGITEVVIYGERELEFTYLNPIMFYRSAEHYLGDMDNATMSVDFSWNFAKGYKIYGEFFLDDIFISRIGSKWYGNKFAYLGGIFITNPLKLKNSELLFEYARVKPFVYTHHYPINVFKHFSTPLGYFTGPNAEDYYLLFTKYFSRESRISFEYELKRHGKNYPDKNIGGDLNLGHRWEDPTQVGFLEGIVETTESFLFNFKYDIYRHYYFSVLFGREIYKTEKRKVNSNIFQAGLSINY
jgi:hypothetical protein